MTSTISAHRSSSTCNVGPVRIFGGCPAGPKREPARLGSRVAATGRGAGWAGGAAGAGAWAGGAAALDSGAGSGTTARGFSETAPAGLADAVDGPAWWAAGSGNGGSAAARASTGASRASSS